MAFCGSSEIGATTAQRIEFCARLADVYNAENQLIHKSRSKALRNSIEPPCDVARVPSMSFGSDPGEEGRDGSLYLAHGIWMRGQRGRVLSYNSSIDACLDDARSDGPP